MFQSMTIFERQTIYSMVYQIPQDSADNRIGGNVPPRRPVIFHLSGNTLFTNGKIRDIISKAGGRIYYCRLKHNSEEYGLMKPRLSREKNVGADENYSGLQSVRWNWEWTRPSWRFLNRRWRRQKMIFRRWVCEKNKLDYKNYIEM